MISMVVLINSSLVNVFLTNNMSRSFKIKSRLIHFHLISWLILAFKVLKSSGESYLSNLNSAVFIILIRIFLSFICLRWISKRRLGPAFLFIVLYLLNRLVSSVKKFNFRDFRIFLLWSDLTSEHVWLFDTVLILQLLILHLIVLFKDKRAFSNWW